MLHFPAKYQEQRVSIDKPLWHWAEILKDFPTKCSDVDLYTNYRGHSLFVEAKPMDAVIPPWQRGHLMAIAKDRKHWVLVVGLRHAVTEDLSRCWSVAWWSWVDKDRWPFGRHRQIGGVAELRAEIDVWRKTIDVMEDANAEYWNCHRILKAMCRRPWKPEVANENAI